MVRPFPLSARRPKPSATSLAAAAPLCKAAPARRTPRNGAVGSCGSLAVIERFIRSLKDECARRIDVPMRVGKMREELALYVRWFNEFRPHQSLAGRTPDEGLLGSRK